MSAKFKCAITLLQPLEQTAMRWLAGAVRQVSGALSLLLSAVATLGERWGKGGNVYTSLTVFNVLVTSSYVILLHPN